MDDGDVVKCKLCEATFNDMDELESHYGGEHPEELKKIQRSLDDAERKEKLFDRVAEEGMMGIGYGDIYNRRGRKAGVHKEWN